MNALICNFNFILYNLPNSLQTQKAEQLEGDTFALKVVNTNLNLHVNIPCKVFSLNFSWWGAIRGDL